MTSKRLLAYLVLVLVVVTVAAILYARVTAGRAQALASENQRKIAQITADTQEKMRKVTRYLAGVAARDGGEALTAVSERNWGAAGKALGDARDVIGVLEEVAPEPDRSTISASRDALQRAQAAVAETNQSDAAKAIGEMVGSLGLLPRSGKT